MPEIKVYQLKTTKNLSKAKQLLSHMPYIHPNFRAIIVAPTESGKTQLMINLIFGDEFMKKLWRTTKGKCISFLPETDVSRLFAQMAHQNKFKPDHFRIYTEWNIEKCEEEYRNLDPKYDNLMIYDDVAFLNFTNRNKKTIIDESFCAGRHRGLSSFISCQKYTHLNENIRCNNCSILVIFRGLDSKELQRIYAEHFETIMTWETYKNMIKSHLKEKYTFIWYDKKGGAFYNNKFEKIEIIEDGKDEFMDDEKTEENNEK